MLKELVVALVKGLNSSPAAIIKKITGFGVSVIMEGTVSQTSPTWVYEFSHSLQQHWQRLI